MIEYNHEEVIYYLLLAKLIVYFVRVTHDVFYAHFVLLCNI